MEFENILVTLKKSKLVIKYNVVLIMKSLMAGFELRTPRMTFSISFHPQQLNASMCSFFSVILEAINHC